MLKRGIVAGTVALGLVVLSAAIAQTFQTQLQQSLEDLEVGDSWIYHDYDKAVATAKETGKPMFVLFRCVPCEACKVFDREVVRQDSALAALYSKFVPVRIVRMNDVNLDQFEFDYDLSWSGFFMNADGAIYGRYGTRAAADSETHISIEGLRAALERVLELHADYPNNKALFEGKRGDGPDYPYSTPREVPTLQEIVQREDARKGCVHCHMIYDGFNKIDMANGEWTNERYFDRVYPLPENVGLVIDPDAGNVVQGVYPDSIAAKAGLQAGDAIQTANGQAILSIADLQWALHHTPTGGRVEIAYERYAGQQTSTKTAVLTLEGDWRRQDISWRASMWTLRPALGVWAPDIDDHKRRELGLPLDTLAARVRWIPNEAAREAGLRNDDIIVSVDGRTQRESHGEREARFRLEYEPDQTVTLGVLRNGEMLTIRTPLRND